MPLEKMSQNIEVAVKGLPIENHRDELVEAVVKFPVVVITGETGCGKTTQLPQYLHKAGFSKDGIIGVTQPRRVAATSVASRVSYEMGTRLGAEVGYQVRFDDCTSSTTKIKYMTDGCLLREFLDDQELSRYSVMVLDEAHERSLATDILFGLVKKLLQKPPAELRHRRQALKVVVMSATLDIDKFSAFFDRCPVISVPGRCYPVEIHYSVSDEAFDAKKLTYMSQLSRVVMDIHLDHPEGDILVFLTGQAEIENACNRLFQAAETIDYENDVRCKTIHGLLILPLYGAMASELQQRVFQPVDEGIRRVVMATNIAATSITIDGVVYVVDCGYVKQLEYNPRTGLDSLDIVPTSKSEATQRAGRAGRTRPGKCYRLYSAKHYDSLPDATVPEIQRASLTSVVLSLKCMEIGNVLEFHYLDPPSEKMTLEALRQLYCFEAIDADGKVTRLGRQLVEFPIQPSLARTLVRSKQLRCEAAMLPIVAMLTVENVFVKPGSKKEAERAMEVHAELAREGGGSSDFSTLLATYQLATEGGSIREWCSEHCVHWRAIKTAQNVCEQLGAILDRQEVGGAEEDDEETLSASMSQRARQSLCYGLFGNVARTVPGRRSYRTMDGHGTVAYIHPSSVLFGRDSSPEWVVYHELVDTAKTYMRTLCPVKYSWIKDLLPRLHNVDVYRLSECAAKRPRKDSESSPSSPLPSPKKVAEGENQVAKAALNERVALAKERYLARKATVQ